MSKFAMNYKNIFEIDTAGNQDPKGDLTKATWAVMAAGISGVTPAANETDDNTAYYDGSGFTDTDVTGKRITLAFSGHRVVGNAAQDFIAGKFLSIGENLKTLARWTNPDGTKIVSNVTITAIVPMGGNANAKQTFSYTLSFNGKPIKYGTDDKEIEYDLDSTDSADGTINTGADAGKTESQV
ncbi:phage tail tube protein [Lactiplantibacillus mudanjiangensis]|uniref:Capsid protein [Lactobacillus plantarum] n=1 Tax=Lactiplantibacillus mudanjiangensis TaxID=1296538 RepID=A0A660DWY6_9LACO|nr:capsid protein [Lactiplantibacillus mudanjiangensis]VDG26347.1 capsid protein [Lactobacillus plantarum] [Lactiplantibacillus mudanjiangensis]VDG27871.1 capsid protein [Lactobacillus plantarum] [Lactiplantibacillus mudanjiangensis]